jgi:nucleoid DNA-binding protein
MAEKAKKPAAKSMTQTEFYTALAEATGKSKAEVKEFYEALSTLIVKELTNKKGTGSLKLPNLFKLTLKKKPAVKGGELFFNRLTGKEEKRKPKPASASVRARALKPLNEKVTK